MVNPYALLLARAKSEVKRFWFLNTVFVEGSKKYT